MALTPSKWSDRCAVSKSEMGRRFLARLDNAVAETDLSRKQWIEQAISLMLRRKKPQRLGLTPSELLHDRKVVLVRIDNAIVDAIDNRCEHLGYTRTLFILDACVTKMAVAARSEHN